MKRKAFHSLLLGASMMTMGAFQAAATINFSEYTLPNGLHVILQEDHRRMRTRNALVLRTFLNICCLKEVRILNAANT